MASVSPDSPIYAISILRSTTNSRRDIRAGKIDYLVVYRFDRLTRSLSDLATLVAVFEKHGTKLISVTENLSRYPVLGRQQVEVTA